MRSITDTAHGPCAIDAPSVFPPPPKAHPTAATVGHTCAAAPGVEHPPPHPGERSSTPTAPRTDGLNATRRHPYG